MASSSSSGAQTASGSTSTRRAADLDPGWKIRWLAARRAAVALLVPLLYVVPALGLYSSFVLWPLGRLVVLSLQQWDGLTPARFVGLDNFAALWNDPGFAAEVRHSLFWLLVTLLVPTLLGLSLALLLRAIPPVQRTVLRALLVVPLLLPTVLIAVTWRLFYNPLAGPLTDSLQALHLGSLAGDWLGDPSLALPAVVTPACWASFGLSMLLCEAALAAISPEVLAAASLDGAGVVARFWFVVLPTLRGALPVALVVTGFCAVPSYDLVLLLTNGGPGYATTTLSLDAYGRAFGGGQVGLGAALGCLQGLAGLLLAGYALLVARGQHRSETDGELASRTIGTRRRAISTALSLLAALIAGVLLLPLVWLVVVALRSEHGETLWGALRDNLHTVWAQGFGSAVAGSLAVALVVVAVTLLVALPAAFVLASTHARLVRVVAAVLLSLGLFQPLAVLIIPLFYTLSGFGLLQGSWLYDAAALALTQTARVIPAALLVLWIGMAGLPSGVLEAAALDGAAPRHVLLFIVLPLVLPLAAVVLIWSFLLSWNDYLLPTVVIQDDSLQTVPMALSHFIGRFDTEYGLLATGALLALVPLLLLYGGLFGLLAQGVRGLRPSVQGR